MTFSVPAEIETSCFGASSAVFSISSGMPGAASMKSPFAAFTRLHLFAQRLVFAHAVEELAHQLVALILTRYLRV